MGKGLGSLRDAERRWLEQEPTILLTHSLQGYRYCDLLLSNGKRAAARDRAAKALEIARRNNWLLEIALDSLTLGRAQLARALQNQAIGPSTETADADRGAATARLNEAVEGLRASGANHHLARGLIARAAFRRAIGDWDGAKRDLDEVEEIAEPGPMRGLISAT